MSEKWLKNVNFHTGFSRRFWVTPSYTHVYETCFLGFRPAMMISETFPAHKKPFLKNLCLTYNRSLLLHWQLDKYVFIIGFKFRLKMTKYKRYTSHFIGGNINDLL